MTENGCEKFDYIWLWWCIHKMLLYKKDAGAKKRCWWKKKELVQINKKIVSCWCKKKGCERIANKGVGGGDVTSLVRVIKI